MGEQVRDEQGTVYPLGNLLGEGGQGQVFEVPGKPSLAIKRFHERPSGEGGRAQLRRKVTALQAKRLDKSLPQAAWPQFPVFTEQREWCGYAMRRVKGVPLLPALFLNPDRLEKKFPQIRRPDLCALALELLKAVEFLQEEGVAIGDYNPLNFRYDLRRKQLGLLDTDAFQVRHDGSVIPCPVTSPEMTPPELLNTRVKHHYRSPGVPPPSSSAPRSWPS